MIPVVFINYHAEVHRGAWWDQTLIEWMLAHSRHDIRTFSGSWAGVPDSDGIVIVTPGHYEDVEPLNRRLERYRWAIVIVTSDEEDKFPWHQIRMPGTLRVWKQHPIHSNPDTVLPLGPPPKDLTPALTPRDLAWFFAGQVTHPRREQLVEALQADGRRGVLHTTEAFLTGVDWDDYAYQMRRTQLAPAPSGPNTADSFRLYEALELGAVPVVDIGPMRGDYRVGYWDEAFYTARPFEVLSHWSGFRTVTYTPELRVRCEAWWQLEKRNLARRLDTEITRLSGVGPGGLTAVVSTSPIPSHPSTGHIRQTVESILERSDCEVIVAADGVRAEQRDMTDRYVEYLDALVHLSRTEWEDRVWVDYTGEWLHQAGTVKRALRHVWTPSVLFAEHDTPLVGEIPFYRLQDALRQFDVIRLHHEAEIHPEHRHLTEGPPVTVGPDVFQPTVQWSQRPHIASVETYRRILDEFPDTDRTMVEDKLHSIAQVRGWQWLRTAIYTPDGDIKRSTHTDGREGASKYEMRF